MEVAFFLKDGVRLSALLAEHELIGILAHLVIEHGGSNLSSKDNRSVALDFARRCKLLEHKFEHMLRLPSKVLRYLQEIVQDCPVALQVPPYLRDLKPLLVEDRFRKLLSCFSQHCFVVHRKGRHPRIDYKCLGEKEHPAFMKLPASL